VTAGGTRDTLQAALGATYSLEREIGRGGMATVYLAQDTKHHRPVALKVLHPELAASLGPERFRREITFAAGLQHPHILTVLDSGETLDGQLWFTMPYVEGESLRARLTRERQLPIEEAVRITREVGGALDFAHRRGVIHRDIKPENILLTADGQALVADFGIARALGPSGDETLTDAGTAIGTPAYMSPEQAAGERSLDARTDTYSLAAVLYEMLAGEPPFTGPTAQAVIAKRLSSEAPSVRRSRPTVSDGTESAIRKALSVVPADRFGTTGEFVKSLDTVRASATTAPRVATRATPVPGGRRAPVGAALLGLGFLIGVGVLFAWRGRTGSANDVTGAVRVAVLPFDNLGDTADAYFADGLTDAVRGKLTAVPGLAVIAPASSAQYRHTTKTPQQISAELGGVRYLLVGKVRWAKTANGGSRVQVSPALVDATTGTDSWEQPFDAPLTDVFQVQGDIAGRVVQALGVALNAGARQTITDRPTQNLEAYDAFLKGEAASNGTNDANALMLATRYYERAVSLDSAFAIAWARLGRVNAALYFNGSPTPARADATRRAADRAKVLGPGRAEGYLAEGDYWELIRGDHHHALSEYMAGVKVAPSNAELLTAASLAEESLGNWDDALAHLRQASTLDPRDATTARRISTAYLWLRRYPEAAAAVDHMLALNPDSPGGIESKAMVALAQSDLSGARAAIAAAPNTIDRGVLMVQFANYWDLYWVPDDAGQRYLLTVRPETFGDRAPWAECLAETYALRGDVQRARIYADSARIAFGIVLAATPEDAQSHAELGVALAILGRKSEAVAEVQRAVSAVPLSADGYSGPYYQHLLVRVYLMNGETDKALDALEPLLKVPYFLSPGWLRIDPAFASLHGNPRFERLIAEPAGAKPAA
jgi:TolB-like protein/tetratricopeptide (TPR) repeat protein/tRNA A-37 threonylcarbamoyl transferase component Bud32